MKDVIKLNTGEVCIIYQSGLGLVKINGEIDLSSYRILYNYISYFIKSRHCPIIFDLQEMTFMDNAGGIRLLLDIAKILGFRRIAVVNAAPNIKRLLETAKLNEYIFIGDDIEEAGKVITAWERQVPNLRKSA